MLSVATGLLILIVIVGLFIAINLSTNEKSSSNENAEERRFYSGVTFGGENVTEAKLLIDRVKNCTNLFVVQSGPLQENINAINEICEYAASSGLHTLIYFTAAENKRSLLSSFLSNFRVWGNNIGVYFDDEPGGKMLDNTWGVRLFDPTANDTISMVMLT